MEHVCQVLKIDVGKKKRSPAISTELEIVCKLEWPKISVSRCAKLGEICFLKFLTSLTPLLQLKLKLFRVERSLSGKGRENDGKIYQGMTLVVGSVLKYSRGNNNLTPS